MAPPKFQFQPNMADVGRLMPGVRDHLAHEADSALGHELDAVLTALYQRDRQLEDYLTGLKPGGGVGVFLGEGGTSTSLVYGGAGYTNGMSGEVVEGWDANITCPFFLASPAFSALGSLYLFTFDFHIEMTQSAAGSGVPSLTVMLQNGSATNSAPFLPNAGTTTVQYLSSPYAYPLSPVVGVRVRQQSGATPFGASNLSFTAALDYVSVLQLA